MSKHTIRISQHSDNFAPFHELEEELACDLNGRFWGTVSKGSFVGSDDFEPIRGGDVEPEDYVSEAFDRLVEEMTKELPPKERETFIAIYLEQVKQATYAKTRGVRRQTINDQVKRIRKKLQTKIDTDPFWGRFLKRWRGQ